MNGCIGLGDSWGDDGGHVNRTSLCTIDLRSAQAGGDTNSVVQLEAGGQGMRQTVKREDQEAEAERRVTS